MAEDSAGVLDATPCHVVVVDHYDSYTWNLVQLLAEVTGVVPTVVEHDQVTAAELAEFSHIVLSPGPGHPANPADFGLGGAVFTAGPPVLGVCLGMQALVHFHGGEVTRVPPAHGVVSPIVHDAAGLFADIPSPFDGVRYHSLAAVSVPPQLRVTARVQRSPTTTDVVMAVEHSSKRLWGVQFHPESVLSQHGAQLMRNFLA